MRDRELREVAVEAWYLIYTKPRRERAALENLERQGYQAYLPRVRVRRRVGGRYAALVEPMFPRYLFLRLSDRTDDWGPIRSTVGVSRLVHFGADPARVPDGFISALQSAADAVGVQNRPATCLKPGQRIRIVDGAMAGLEAVYHARSGSERVVVLLEVAQRRVRVDLGEDSVEPA